MTMQDSYFHIVMAISAIIALSINSMTALRGWQGWLELRRAELERRPDGTSAATNARIEVAALKERVRRLEAIEAGVEGGERLGRSPRLACQLPLPNPRKSLHAPLRTRFPRFSFT